MSDELRRPADEVEHAPTAPPAESPPDGPAFEPTPYPKPAMELTAATQELLGAMFTTPKELRHLAEQHFGELFVPTEVLAESPHSAIFALHPDRTGRIVVHAERARHWSPFRVTRVEAGRDGGRLSL